MKNKILFILVLFIGIVFINGCVKENSLLTKYPKDAPNAGNFFINATSARQAAQSPFAIMTQIPHDFRRYWVTMQDIFTDDSYSRNVGDRLWELNWTAGPLWYNNYSWYFCFYKGINNANFAIDGIPTSSDPTFTPDQQAKYIAVAKLAKGFCYIELTTKWGDAIYWPHFLTNVDSAFIGRQPRADVMAHAIQDLIYAKDNLPDSWTGDDVGFPTKAAAAAMLAKAYLFTRDWTNAVTAAANALTIADAEGYTLMPDYLYMMSWQCQLDGTNTEFIYSFPFLLDGTQTGNQNEMMVERRVRDAPSQVKAIYGGGWGYALPSQNLVNAFEPGDPRRKYSMWIPGDFYGVYNQSASFPIGPDYLIDQSTRDTITHIPAITVNQGDSVFYRHVWSYSNTNTRKIWEPDMKDGVWLEIDEQQDGYDIPLLRYADLILMYAEALIESGDYAAGMTQLNRVRARPSVNLPPLTATDQNDARIKLRHERRIELNMEGLRLNDLLRWTADDGVSGTEIGSYLRELFGAGLNAKPILMRYDDMVTLKNQNLSFPKNFLMSLPQEELDRNPQIHNNPGW